MYRLVVYWTDGDTGHTDAVSSLEDVRALESIVIDQWNKPFVAIEDTQIEVLCARFGWVSIVCCDACRSDPVRHPCGG